MIHRHLEQKFSVDQAPVLTYSPATKQIVILSRNSLADENQLPLWPLWEEERSALVYSERGLNRSSCKDLF